MNEEVLFFKIWIWWRPRVVRELLMELLCAKYNLELIKHPHTRYNCTLISDDMMIWVRGNMIDVVFLNKESKEAKKDYLYHLFYKIGRRKK